MNVALKNPVETNFALIATWFAAAMVLVFIPETVQAATSTVMVMVVGGGTVSPDYNGRQLVIGQTYKLQARPKSGFDFMGWTGSVAADTDTISFVMAPNLTFTATFIDVKRPKLSIKTPANKSTLTTGTVTVTGIASDNSTLAQVLYQLNGTGWVGASTGSGWSNWWADVSLAPGTNVVRACAVDAAGNVSPTNQITLYCRVVPDSLDRQTMAISANGAVDFTMTFTNTSFSQSAANTNFDDGVGTYAFTPIDLTRGKLTVSYAAPPNATNDGKTAYLQFTNINAGWFTNNDGSMSTFVFLPATNLVFASLSGTNISLLSTNGNTQRILSFTAEPAIVNNGHLFNVANPLVISVSSAYAGNIGDRVSVLFDRYTRSGAVTNTYLGTVIAATGNGVGTNTVTVLFDSSSFVSQSYAPIAGSLLNVLTFYYTNFVSGTLDSTGTGTYTYATYSPVGALLNLTQTNENGFYVLTFSSTNGSGTYYEEYIPRDGASASDAGVFSP